MNRSFPAITGAIRGEIRHNEPLSRHTSLRVGGVSDLFVIPADRSDLEVLAALAAREGIPLLPLGGGYNILPRDGGFRGVVVSLSRLTAVEEREGGVLIAEAGVVNGRLVRFAEERRLGGLEFLIGIPGTVGGGLAMNAGAHGEAMCDRVASVTSLADGIAATRRREELRYGYRFLTLAPAEIILAASFQLVREEPGEIAVRLERNLAYRRQAQRITLPNAGSFFRNPPGEQAWRLIDAAGLRGHRIGGAQVSEVHSNFLVNLGDATARDFLELAELIKTRVRETSGILLETEVRIVGEE